MLGKEDFVLVQLLGPDSPQVRAMVAAANVPGMEGAVHEMLRSLARQRGWNPDDPPRFALPRDLSPSDYPVGTAMSGDVPGEEVGPSDEDMPGSIGVYGQSGTGKSTLVKLLLLAFMGNGKARPGRRFWIWDSHSEFRDLLRFFGPGEVVWLTPDELALSPFEVPTGQDGRPVMAPDKWINNLREVMRLVWANEPTLNLLSEVLAHEYERRGLPGKGGDYPSLSEVIEAVRQLNPPRGSDRARAKEKLLDRLESLRAMLPGLDVKRSRNLARLLDTSVILDISDVRDVARPVLFALLATAREEILKGCGAAGVNRMELIEEAHLLLGAETNRRMADLMEGKPSSFLRGLRKTGTSAIVVSQLARDLSPSVRGNLSSVIVLRQGDRECVREAAGMLNLEPWREDEVARLPNRHAIARFSRHGEPVYLAIRDARALLPPDLPPPSREEARERSRPVLEAIPYVKGGGLPQGEGSRAAGNGLGGTLPEAREGGVAPGPGTGSGARPPDGGLHPRERKVFARIAERPWELIEDRVDALGLDREAEGDARAKLGARGLIALAGKVGAKNRLFELTARGRELAGTMGLTVAKTGKGSAPHEAIVQYVQRSLGRHSAAFRFQRAGVAPTTGGVQPDLLLVGPRGSRIPIQACCANQPGYEGNVLLRLGRLALLGPGDADRVDFVVAVCVNKRHREAVERALERENGGRLPDRVVLLDFDGIMSPGFDWASVLEFPV